MGITITRVWFCSLCEARNKPLLDDKFVAIGRSEEKLYLHTAKKHTNKFHKGFTPHLIQIKKLNRKESTVDISVTCAMEGCGVSFARATAGGKFEVTILRIENTVIPLSEWNALVSYTKNGYELD